MSAEWRLGLSKNILLGPLKLWNSVTIARRYRCRDKSTLLLRMQYRRRRVRILTHTLEVPSRTILQKALNISIHVLLATGSFYARLDKAEKALELYHAALAKCGNREVPIKFKILNLIDRTHCDLRQYDMALESCNEALIGRINVRHGLCTLLFRTLRYGTLNGFRTH
jgi:hypothetical protein